MSAIEVFTEKDYKGVSASLGFGDFKPSDIKTSTIVGESHGKSYEFPMDVGQKTFKDDAIKSMKINPHVNVKVYESADEGGRYVEIVNDTDEVMKIPDLSAKQFTFDDKISRIVTASVKSKDSVQKVTVVDVIGDNVSPGGDEKFTVGGSDDFHLKLLVVIIVFFTILLYVSRGGITFTPCSNVLSGFFQ